MSAATLWGMTTLSGPTEVLRVKSAGRATNRDANWGGEPNSATTQAGERIPVLRVRSTRNLHPSEINVHQGIPVTSVARVLVDISGLVGKGQLKGLMHEASRNGLLRFEEVRAVADRARGRKGVRVLREIIDDWDPQTALTRNEFEQYCSGLYRKANLPVPLVNRIVGGFEVDFFWPQFALIVEVDGGKDHNLPFGNERDKEKDSQLRLRGFVVLRLTWAMLKRDPEGSVSKIRAHMELCRSEGRQASPGFSTASNGHFEAA